MTWRAAGTRAGRRTGGPGVTLLVLTFPVALAGYPSAANAQQEAFAGSLIAFTTAAAGTYGDEGPRVRAALDTMAAALAEWDRAIQELESRVAAERARATPAGAAETRLKLARMYLARGRLADARRELEIAGRANIPNGSVHLLRGLVQQLSGGDAEAAAAFDAAWKLDPDDGVAAYYRVRYGPAARRPDALASLRRAYSALAAGDARERANAAPFPAPGLIDDGAVDAPLPFPSAYAGGYSLLAQGRFDSAIAFFRQAAAADPLLADAAAGSPSLRAASAALRSGRLAEAQQHLERAIAKAPASSEAHRLLGLVYGAAGRYDASVEQFEMALRLSPRDERSRVALGRVLADAGRHSDAVQVLERATALLPDSALAHWWLGWVHETLNRTSDARREFEAAAAIGGLAGMSRLYASIGRLARIEGDFAAAVAAFERRVRLSPNDPAARRDLAAAYLEQDRPDEACSELVAALLIDPRDAGAHAGIGRILLDAGRYEDAVLALRRALEIAPALGDAQYALATALMRLGRTAEAARELEAFERGRRERLADRRHDLAVQVLREEAALRTAEGGHDRAAALWRQVVEREPNRPEHHVGLAEALTRAGRIDAAIGAYEAAAALGASAEVYRALADLYARTGRRVDSARAQAMYGRARQQTPQAPGDGR